MGNASAGSIFVDLLLNDSKYVQGLNQSTRATKSASSSWQKEVNNTKNSFSSIVPSINAIAPALAGLGAVLAGSLSVSKVIAYSDEYKNLNSRLSLVTGSAKELADVQDRLFDIAQDTSQPLAATIDAYSRLSNSLNGTQKSQTDLIRLTDLLSKTLLISGANAEGAATFYQQFGQAASSDFKAIGQELQTFADQNPRLYKILNNEALQYGKTLRKMGADGDLSFKFIADAVLKQGAVIDQQTSAIAPTIGKALTDLDNSFLKFIGNSELAKEATGLLAQAITGLSHNIDELGESSQSAESYLGDLALGFLEKAKEITDASEKVERALFLTAWADRAKEDSVEIQAAIDKLSASMQKFEDDRKNSKLDDNILRSPEVAVPAIIDEKAIKAAEAARKKLDDLYTKNETYITGATKDQIKYNESVEELTKLLDAGAITNSDYANGLDRIQKEYDEAADKANIFSFNVEESGKQAARNVQDSFADFLFDPFADGLDGMLMGFLDVVRKMASEAVAAQILGNLFGKNGAVDLGSIFGKIGGAFATTPSSSDTTSSDADAFLSDYYDGMFATGGTIKPGHFGIAGEAGAELIYGGSGGTSVIPAGKLMGGNNPVTVNIINNSGSEISQSQKQNNNGTDINVMIDKAVAKNISDRSSQTNKAITDQSTRALVRR